MIIMRLVFLASGAFARPTLEWLAKSEHDVAAVVSQPPRSSGRGRRTTRTPVSALANELGFETIEAPDVNAPEIVERLGSLDAHVGLVIAFGQKIGPTIRSAAPGGYINLHASLLPQLRGAAPIQWAIANGDTRTGCTVFRLADRMDAGPVLVRSETDIDPSETAGELHDRLAELGVETVRNALTILDENHSAPGTPQDDALATSAPKLAKSDGSVRFDQPVSRVVCHILGMTPWPGATARFEASDGRWENVTLMRAQHAGDDTAPDVPPGTIDERGFVAASNGFVQIVEIKPSSKRIMAWEDFVNGRHVAQGDRFLSVSF